MNFKVDGYDASRKLAGVQFRLYSADLTETEEHYDLSLDNSGVYEMVLETDENGDLMPLVQPASSSNWEIDGNGDIEPAL